MAQRRSRGKVPGGQRRRRPAVRRLRRRIPRGMGGRQIVHSFKRTVWQSAAFSVGAVVASGAISFNLNALPNVTEFTSLFDQYRINAVKITFMPRGNSAEVGTNNNNTKLFTVIDYDDDTAPATLDALLQYETLKTTTVARDHTRYMKPRFAVTTYQTALTTGYGSRTGWIDCESNLVPHYGLKYWVPAVAGANIVDIKTEYYVSFRGVR